MKTFIAIMIGTLAMIGLGPVALADDSTGPVTFKGTVDCRDNAPTVFTVKNRFKKPITFDVADDQDVFSPGNDHSSTVPANTTVTEVFEWYTTVANEQTLTVTVHRPNGNVLRVATRTVPNFWECYPVEPKLADYAATSFTGPDTVVSGETFTRTLVISNLGDGGGDWPVDGTINGISHATVIGVDGTGFERCGIYNYSTGAPNYVRCFNAYLKPGESATMTVTYQAPGSGWTGYVYSGGGYVTKTAMELDAVDRNEYSGDTLNPYESHPLTTIV